MTEHEDDQQTTVIRGIDGPDATRVDDPQTEILGGRQPVADARTRLADNELKGRGDITANAQQTAHDLKQTIGGGDRQQTNIGLGTVIDRRFVLEKKLGQGGMGDVYRARDLIKEQARDPNPFIALKILGAEFSTRPEAWISLQREAKKAQTLAHPRIATVHDFQVDRESGLCFITMEELQGTSLDVLINENPGGLADRNRAHSIVLSIADGLEYAHRRGIIHSDLKPSNVFISKEGEVKILDFGIARSMPGTDSDEFDAGALGALTPAYATCEMFERQPPHPSDDLYALGIIAYKLYTGEHPYEEALSQPQPARAAREMALKPSRPGGLKRNQWRAVAQCLMLERDLRPADAGRFLSDFRRQSPIPRLLGGGLLLSSILLVWAIWFRVPVLEPDIPFDQLPPEVQESFNLALEEGWMVYQHKDYNGALMFFLNAFELHPYNPDALEGLEAVVEVVLAEEVPDDRIRIETKLEQLADLLSYDALANNSKLLDYQEKLQSRLAP
jgi:serine/threonine protein kinase